MKNKKREKMILKHVVDLGLLEENVGRVEEGSERCRHELGERPVHGRVQGEGDSVHGAVASRDSDLQEPSGPMV